MKKISVGLIVYVTIFALSSLTNAATLSAIYKFEGLNSATTSFEGLDFTNDGTLWITSAPNSAAKSVFAVDLANEKILSNTQTSLFNPVALASDGTQLFIGNNYKAGYGFDLADKVYAGSIISPEEGITVSASPIFTLGVAGFLGIDAKKTCMEPEGAAYLNEYIYFSCQDSKEVIKVNPATGAVVERYNIGVTVLGVGATEDKLILGDYTNHALLLYDVSIGSVTDSISLASLFIGAESDYEKLTGMAYRVDVENAGKDIRSIPDPDGIAYRNGKIYMTFEHDLRVFEISLNDPPVATPEPGTVLLLGLGLMGLTAGLRKKRA
ncbi:hypothetical protein U27_02466 [Candidatus Vecturithrix granuli]|uniref:Ice-binding protein C-terminal domain-containing protein n=1 Tax=Vecturithrix granuli TaxID=1499967 RepID=A0A0S6W7F2_VECG1|nr:hypothetical protein U27_02466 [Candidatus Vecturithrix granuli]